MGDIILWLVSWYSGYVLSYRDLTETATERGFILERSTILHWVQEYTPNEAYKTLFEKHL